MRSQDDLRVQAAKKWLAGLLEEVFKRTSNNCRRKLDKFGIPAGPLLPGDVSPDAIRDWREKSLECARRGFKRLFTVIWSLEQDATDSPADIAKNLTWEVIDEVFNWTENKNNSSKFKDWWAEAGVDFPAGSEGLGMLGDLPERDWDAPLVCEFRTQFEVLLDQLRNDAFSNTSTAQSTRTHLEGVSQEHSTDRTGAGEKLEEKVAASNLLRFDGTLWTVKFCDSESHIADFAGVQYIALVLQQKLAGKLDLKPTDLAYLRYGPEAQPEMGQLEDALPELESRDEVVPLQAAENVRERIEQIDAILESGKSKNPEILLDEKAKCEKYLASGRTKRPGADRSYGQAVFKDNYKRARNAVSKAIKEAIDKMEADKALASLAAHLRANIKVRTTVSYESSIAWTVETGPFPRKKS